MGRTDKKIERIKEGLEKLLKAKKFTKLKDWKQFRAKVNKPLADRLKSADNKIGIVFAADEDEYYVVFEGDKKLRKYDVNGKCLDDDGLDLITEME